MPMFSATGSVPKDRAILRSAVTMMVLSRFSMNNAAATRAVICVARRGVLFDRSSGFADGNT